MQAEDFYPGFKSGNLKWYPDNLLGMLPLEGGKVWYVDGDKTTGGGGTSWEDAFAESDFDGNLSSMSSSIAAGDVILVAARTMAVTDTDPISYTTNLVVNVPQVSIIGVSRGRTQGGLPQLKVGGTTTSPIIEIKAPGVLIANIGINGAGATGGGIKLTDDGGTTSAAFGWSVVGCHFKNCKAHATNGAVGGAIWLGSGGGAWQGLVQSCRFFKCVGGIVIPNSVSTIPVDWVIDNCVFGTSVNTETDVDIYVGTGGAIGLSIRNCSFDTVDVPTGTSGTVQRYIKLASGTKGAITNSNFACIVGESETEITFGSGGSGGDFPTTVRIAGCQGEVGTTGAAQDFGAIFRT